VPIFYRLAAYRDRHDSNGFPLVFLETVKPCPGHPPDRFGSGRFKLLSERKNLVSRGDTMSISRRHFIGSLTAALGAAGLSRLHAMPLQPLRKANGMSETLNTARNMVYVFLNGGASHVDMLDLKVGSWTPDSLGASKIKGYLDWPMAGMPQLAEMTDKFSILRTISAYEAVHIRANYSMLTSRQQTTAVDGKIPHIGSLFAMLTPEVRKPDDILAYAVTLAADNIGQGLLPVNYRMPRLRRDGSISGLVHAWPHLDDRLYLMETPDVKSLDPRDPRMSYRLARNQALEVLKDESIAALNDDPLPPLENALMDDYTRQLDGAARILKANKGAHVIFLDLPGWDTHSKIYDLEAPRNILNLTNAFDNAMAHLIRELEQAPSPTPGVANLLDETLIVATSEFGRTPGPLNKANGRDHWASINPVFLAGGGIRGGSVFGTSDSEGRYITDPGWNRGRIIQIPDLNATLASALGIDWNYELKMPDGSLLRLIENQDGSQAEPLVELFNV
jgi:hypothetical protein